MQSRKKKLIVTILITYVLIELVCFAFIKSGYIKTRLPNFSYQYTLTTYPFEIGDIDSVWGTWHYREHTQRTDDCMQFDYSINSFGARDVERTLHAKDTDRVLVLGDSFMEGYGMEEGKRLSNQLEKKTNRDFINFSCQGFGTTQEYLLYKTLGSRFDHSTVLIGIFPFNDFEDNDTALHMNPYYKRFRPYFKGDFPNYQLVYREDSIQKTNFNKPGFFRKENSGKARVVRFLRAYTCWFNILTYALDFKTVSRQQQAPGYYHYSGEQWNKMCFILQKIRELARGKKLVLITLPTAADIRAYKKAGMPPLHVAMDSLCKTLEAEYVDLLPPFAGKPNAEKLFYFDCDPHWNEAGNAFAAEILEPVFKRAAAGKEK